MTLSTNQVMGSEQVLIRGQKRFVILVGLFVVVVSFAYGFAKASGRLAQASMPSIAAARPISQSQLPPELRGMLPSDAQVAAMGTDVTINGLAANMISFTIDRDLRSFVFEHRTLWKYKGFEARQQSSDRRAISFAMNKTTGQRVSLVVWAVPEAVRKVVSNGYALQGTLSLIEPGTERRTMPGLEIMPEATSGVVVASTDLGKRTFTGTFNNPGTVEESRSFYDSRLLVDGWQGVSYRGDLTSNQAIYRRNNQELTLVFAQAPDNLSSRGPVAGRTLVTAVLSIAEE